MGDFFKAIFENWGSIPAWLKWTVLLGIVFTVVGIVINKFIPLAEHIQKRRKNRKNKKKKDVKEIKTSLQNHQFFEYMTHFINYKIKSIDLDNEAKNYIILDKLIPLKIENFQKSFMNFLDEVDYDEMKDIEIKKLFISKIYSSTEEYEKEFLALGNTPEEHEVAKLILDRFNEFDLTNGEMAISMINDIFDSTVYLSNISKVNSSLYILMMPFELLFSSAEKTFKSINGHLNGKIFHGKKF